jgi:hypothetical protein
MQSLKPGERVPQRSDMLSSSMRSPTSQNAKGSWPDLTVGGFDSNLDWTQHRTHLLVPYLGLETFTKNPANLFGLINARANSLPQEWALYDSEQLRSAWGIGSLEVAFHWVQSLCVAMTMKRSHDGSETTLIGVMLLGSYGPVLSLRLRPSSCVYSTDRPSNCSRSDGC